MNPTYDFSGQVALVTGAGGGMGLDTARAFAASGAAVVLADGNEQALRAATGSTWPSTTPASCCRSLTRPTNWPAARGSLRRGCSCFCADATMIAVGTSSPMQTL